VLYLHVAPFLPEIFGHEAAVAMVRFVLTAKKTASIQTRTIDGLDLALCHEVQEFLRIN
jgi:hypothetical protein